MKVHNRLILFWLLLPGPLLLPGLTSACDLEEIGDLLATETVHLDFRQTKRVASLSRPLISTGVIWMNADRQLVWQVQSPIKSTMVINAGSVKQFNRRDELLSGINNQIVMDLAGIFLNLLAGEFDQLEQSFNQYLQCEDENWSLTLEPTTDTFQSLFNFIELAGSDSLNKISFQEQRGDTTQIDLNLAQSELPNFEAYLD